MLERSRGLSPEALSGVAALEADVVAADGGRLKLEWGALATRPVDEVNDVLWRESGRIVGFVGLYAFGGATMEVTGMVHPDVRRRGVGAALLDEAMGLARERGRDKFLLVAPRTSVGARVLAESRGGVIEHSEHAMDLEGPAPEGPSDPDVLLRAAAEGDAEDLSRILDEAFGESHASPPPDGPGSATLVAERGGRVIATLRLSRAPDVWGVYGFAVEAALRGRGIGRYLLRRVSAQAGLAGVHRLHLEVSVDNDRALGLYTSVGFARTATEDYYAIPV